ncbi:hypothetical protein LJC23_02100 [Desulfovibrio sp. OttesenSCG-928-I05]|nr:hypothetical protein [Desulfovibrio sp. OttesenSCG-928-I05]
MTDTVSPSIELARSYLQSDFPKDDPLSEVLVESLWALAGEAAVKGDLELCDRATDRLPLDVEFFYDMKMFYPKEVLAEIVKGFNMGKVIEFFGEDYLES